MIKVEAQQGRNATAMSGRVWKHSTSPDGEHPDSLFSNAGFDAFAPHFRGSFLRARRLDLDQQDTDEDNDVELPDDAAGAWAAVLIDVHEKTKDDGKPDQSKGTQTNAT